MKKSLYISRGLLIVVGLLLLADVVIWVSIGSDARVPEDTEIYFFDVGQGDSQLIVIPKAGGTKGKITILIDGGPPNTRALQELDKILGGYDRYLDVMIMTHPQQDHFGGLIDIIGKYDIGAFISSGRTSESQSYANLIQALLENNVPYIALAAGDVIAYGEQSLSVLSPTKEFFLSADANDASLVTMFSSGSLQALFTGDIGFDVEKDIVERVGVLAAEILKIAHHGSRFSSGSTFLNAVDPEIGMIQVGKNRYGHPTAEVLDRIKKIGASILRTDEKGTIKVTFDGEKIELFSERKTN